MGSIERHGLGLFFDKDKLRGMGSGLSLDELVLRVDAKTAFKANIAKHQKLMKLRSGRSRAADVVESIVYAGADYQEIYRSKIELDAPGDALPVLLGAKTMHAPIQKGETEPAYDVAAVSP